MPKLVDVENIGLIEVPDDMGENELLEFVGTLDQGALPAAGNALMQQGGRMVGGGMMGLTRVGLKEPPPIMSAAQVESPAGMAAYERRRAAWEKRVKEVPPEVYQARAAELEASPTFQMGKALQQGAEEAFPVNPLRQDDYLTQIASGIGSLPVSVVPGLGQLAYGFSAGEDAAQKTGKFYDAQIAQALAEGDIREVNRLQAEKPVKQYQSALYTAPIGALTEFGIGAVPAFGRAVAGQVNKSIFKEAARTAVEEGAQEVSEQWLGNAVAKKTYNPEQKLTEGLFESGAAGSGVGALVGLIGGKAGRVAANQRLAQELNAPLSEAQIKEIIARQRAGGPAIGGDVELQPALDEIVANRTANVAAIGGDPSNPLPNATATLAGINSGGAPSGPIRITPPEEGFTIPEMQLEMEAAGEEVTPVIPIAETPTTTENAVQEQGAGESLLRAEKPQPEVQVGLSEVDQGGRPAEGAGAEIQTEVQPLTIEETNEYNGIVDFLDGASASDMLEEEQLDRFEELAGRVSELEQAGFDFNETTGWTKPGVVTQEAVPFSKEPALNPDEYSDYVNLLRRESEAEAGDNSAEFGFGEKQALTLYRTKIATGVAPAAPAEVPVTPSETPTIPAVVTPTPVTPTTSRTFPFQNRTVDGMIDRDTGEIVAFAKSIVGTPEERGSQPKYTIKVDEDVTIEAQSEKSLNNALRKISSGAPVRVFRNAGKGVTLDFNKPGPVTPAPTPPVAAPTSPTRTVVLTPGAVTVTQTPVKPAAAKAPKSKKAREWASKGDILDDIISLGGVMSKSQAKKEKRLEKIKDLYDDAPRLDPYFNKIFGGRSRGTASRNQPDQLLAELATENPGKYGDMSVSEFWAEVDKAARGRKGDVVAMKQEAKAAAAGAEEAMGLDAFLQAQDEAFVDSQTEGMQNAGEPNGPVEVSVGSLAIGDKFKIQGEQFEVTAVTPDGDYTIRDGDKFGVQQLTENDTIFVDEPPDRGPGDAFEFPTEEPAAPTERKPRLAAGQNQGDLISSTQVEDFALVGEKGVDLEARKQKAQAAARAAAEAKAAQEKAQTQIDLGDAVAEASDAVAQFVESITPKAGITEGPTPEESARRVLKAFADLAAVAIRKGIQTASEWAASINLKLSPALQHAWDQAQGSAVEPTAEILADVENIAKEAPSSDFGMIYSTAEEPVTTKRGGFEDTVAGRRALTPEVLDAGVQLATDAFNEAGVKFRPVTENLFAPVEGLDQEDAGRRLIKIAKEKFIKAKADGRGDTMFALINSLRNQFSVADGFSQETRDELYRIGQSEASEAGRQLASLNASVKDFVAFARNVTGYLTSVYSDTFNGREVAKILDRILSAYRGQFTQTEIDKIVGENPQLQPVVEQLGVMALADTGGRVYRAVQGRLKVKPPAAKNNKAAKRQALEDEAIAQIIENALALGVTEAPKVPSQKLTPDARLALMTTPTTQAKVQKATEDAVKDAEFNAGWAAMMAEATGDMALMQQYREAKAAGDEPTPQSIEDGLNLPEYAHWRTIRDGFLNYSPTTLKLAQDVIRGRFKGVQFGEKKVAPPAPPKIDLNRLVQQPNAEMSRVIGEQLNAVAQIMDLAGASPEAKARVMQMITANVGSQVQLARQRVLNSFLDVKTKSGPTTASDRLQRLINAGITEDPRYRSQATRDLLKRVAKTYLNGDEFLKMATQTRAEKLAFLTGKLNQITAAEKLTDEWMQGAVWTHLTERMMESENSVVSQIVGANDVKFDLAQPKTDAQVAADRAKAVNRLAGGIRAGLLDQRIAESVAKNPALQRLVPKMSDLVKRVLETPQGTQAQLAKAFSQALLSELAIDQALADKTGIALAKAFQVKFERARITALSQAVEKLTPNEIRDFGPGTPLWKKIEQFVNAGGMDSAALLQSIAKKAGWKIPTDAEVSRLRDLARLEQELSTANEEEKKKGLTDDIKAAMNLGKRADIMREIQRRWASMTIPIRGNKENRARAINEVVSAELLFKPSFATKQLIDTLTQMFYYTPTRAVSAAVGRYNADKSANRQTRLWKDVGTALEDSYKARFQAFNMALTSALEAAKGRAERDTIMGIQSGIRALDRINAKATEYAKSGDYARATMLRMIGIVQLSYRYASALDALQGTLAEQQEIGAWAESQFRLQGMDPKQARKAARAALGDATAEYAMAQALVGDDPNITPKERRAAAWNVVRARQYQRIKAAGLDVDNLKQVTQDLRSTIGWNVEETGGLGGQIGKGMKGANDWLAKAGIPNPVGRFSNAIAIGINRALTFAGGGFVPSSFEGSAWYKTPEDRTQRKIEAATGLGLSGALAALVLSGALQVFTKWPDDKEEADLWERDGHKPNTMELDLPGGKILRVSLNTGPIQIARPALAGVGELQYQVARRNRLNQKAEAAAKKKGLKFEPRELTAKDMAGALAYGAYSAVAQGRTASGLIGSGTYRQAPDLGKIVAGAVSPLIPFGPLVRELTAMSGAQFNPKDQTFINLLAPTPWSGKVDRNFLGDPVGTPRATERIMSILTGGSAIVGGNETDRAYQVLAKTGWTPATQQNNRFHQFGRVERQATPEELTRMQEVRAVELKTRISQLDPATATKRQLDRIEDIANAKSKKAVGIR